MAIAQLGTPDGVLVRMDDSVTTSAITTEQTMLTYNLVGRAMGMNNRLRFTIYCSLTTVTLLPGTITIRIKYGTATLTLGGGALALIGSAINAPFIISGNLSNKSNTNSQYFYGEIRQQAGGLSLGQQVSQQAIKPAIDSTVDQQFSMTVQFSNAANSLVVETAEATLD